MSKRTKREYNAADEDVVRDAEQKDKNERDQELEDIKAILAMPQGVRFFRRLMQEGRVFQTTFTGNSNTFFLEGHRNLALKFFSDVCEAAPSKVPDLLIQEEK